MESACKSIAGYVAAVCLFINSGSRSGRAWFKAQAGGERSRRSGPGGARCPPPPGGPAVAGAAVRTGARRRGRGTWAPRQTLATTERLRAGRGAGGGAERQPKERDGWASTPSTALQGPIVLLEQLMCPLFIESLKQF